MRIFTYRNVPHPYDPIHPKARHLHPNPLSHYPYETHPNLHRDKKNSDDFLQLRSTYRHCFVLDCHCPVKPGETRHRRYPDRHSLGPRSDYASRQDLLHRRFDEKSNLLGNCRPLFPQNRRFVWIQSRFASSPIPFHPMRCLLRRCSLS